MINYQILHMNLFSYTQLNIYGCICVMQLQVNIDTLYYYLYNILLS